MLVIEFGCGGFGRDFDFYLGDLRMLWLLIWDEEGGDNIFSLVGLRKFWELLNSTWIGFLDWLADWFWDKLGTELSLILENGVLLLILFCPILLLNYELLNWL